MTHSSACPVYTGASGPCTCDHLTEQLISTPAPLPEYGANTPAGLLRLARQRGFVKAKAPYPSS